MPEPNHTPKFRRKKQIPQHLNKVYGRLTILREAIGDERLTKYPDRQQVVCLCSCEKEVTRILSHVLNGSTVACGCRPIRDPRVKKCSKCKRIKLRSAFYSQAGGRLKCGLTSQCKPCKEETSKAYRTRYPERMAARRNQNREALRVNAWKSGLKIKYNLTPEGYYTILDQQGGGCGICGSTDSDSRRQFLCVDHDETNLVRGLLCNPCNTTIAFLGDNMPNAIQHFRQIIKYFRRLACCPTRFTPNAIKN